MEAICIYCFTTGRSLCGIKLQNVGQYEDKKNPQRIKCSIYILDTRNQNQPQGIRIDHQIV
jgi:hypothetical protein